MKHVKVATQRVTKSCQIAIVIDFHSYVFSNLHNILTGKYRLIAYFLVEKNVIFLIFIPCARMSFL